MENLKKNPMFQKMYSKLITLFEKNKNYYIIEPLTCIIRLGILSYKEIGTKISISNHKISYHEPSVFQGSIRWSLGDNRKDLAYLYIPIKQAIQLYGNSKNMILFTKAIQGLQKLKKSYNLNKNIVCLSLDLYINTLQLCVENKEIEFEDSDDQILLENIWDSLNIELIIQLFNQCENDIDNCQDYIQAIEKILTIIDKKVEQYLL